MQAAHEDKRKDEEEGGSPEEGEVSAMEEGEAAEAFEDVKALRATLGERATSVLDASKTAKGRDLHEGLTEFKRIAFELAETRDPAVRKLITSDLRELLNGWYRGWIEGSRDLEPDVQALLKTPEGRLQFRVQVFAILCDTGKLGLSPKDKPRGRIKETTFLEHARKCLGRNFGIFDRICSTYDAGSGKRNLDSIGEWVSQNLPKEALERSEKRRIGRADLALAFEKRIRSQLQDTYSVDMERGKLAGFLEGGGDLALKYAALTIFASNPLLFLGAWGARGISESLGYDFGSVLEKFAKAPFRLVARGGKGLLNLLPERLKARMPRGMQQWLSKPTPPTFERVGRVSLSWGDRWRLFLRGNIPVPSLAEKIPKVGALVPSRRLEPGELATEETEKAEETVTRTCQQVLSGDSLQRMLTAIRSKGGEAPPGEVSPTSTTPSPEATTPPVKPEDKDRKPTRPDEYYESFVT